MDHIAKERFGYVGENTREREAINRPSLTFIPGITVMVTVICFNILGDKLRDILDPSLKD